MPTTAVFVLSPRLYVELLRYFPHPLGGAGDGGSATREEIQTVVDSNRSRLGGCSARVIRDLQFHVAGCTNKVEAIATPLEFH
jgi:hypothetical protein